MDRLRVVVSIFWVLTFVGTAAMASKYLIIWRRRHIFNPVAFGVVVSAIALGQGSSWWVGSLSMAPFILIGGFLILKKIRRLEMVGVFLASMVLLAAVRIVLGDELFDLLAWLQSQVALLFISPLTFFAIVMLVDPSTSPFKRSHQVIYAILIALLFFLLGNVTSFSLEAALLIGNIFAYAVNRSFRQ